MVDKGSHPRKTYKGKSPKTKPDSSPFKKSYLLIDYNALVGGRPAEHHTETPKETTVGNSHPRQSERHSDHQTNQSTRNAGETNKHNHESGNKGSMEGKLKVKHVKDQAHPPAKGEPPAMQLHKDMGKQHHQDKPKLKQQHGRQTQGDHSTHQKHGKHKQLLDAQQPAKDHAQQSARGKRLHQGADHAGNSRADSGPAQKKPKQGDWTFKVDYNDHFETSLTAIADIEPMLYRYAAGRLRVSALFRLVVWHLLVYTVPDISSIPAWSHVVSCHN